MGHPALLRHATKGPLRQQRGLLIYRVTQLQLPQHRGQTRRNLVGRDSRGGSGTLCSSSSTVTSLQEFAGDKLCRFPERSPRSDTAQPSSSTATRAPTLATASSPGEAKDRLLGDFPPHLSGGLQELGGRCGGVLGAGDSLTLQGRRGRGKDRSQLPHQNVLCLHCRPWEEGRGLLSPPRESDFLQQDLRPANMTLLAPGTVLRVGALYIQ